ncbi:MAG: hypothetical protein IJK23_07050 [Clostridia bacterium]|nr:hypothetical protein [Clostridia bacterium]
MAKNYQKPNIAFQKLAMTADLSTSCSMDVNYAEFSCPVLIPEWGETVFTSDTCDWSNDQFYICYHVPTAGSNVFGS